MSDIPNSNSNSSSKRRLSQIDDTIEYLSQEVNTLHDFVDKTEYGCSLMTVKMKREKVKAVAAIAKSQAVLANMKLMIAENDLHMEIERLKNFKKRKLEGNEGNSQVDTPSPPQVTAPTTATVSVQTIESMSNKKKKRRHNSLRKSPVDISSDETVIIPTTHERAHTHSHSALQSLVEAPQTPQTSFSLSLFTQTPANKSNDSEASLSSSVKAEFNEPYEKKQTQETVKKSPTKKNKSESKSKSKHVSKHTQSPTDRTKTVAELRKGVNTASNHMDSYSRPASSTNNTRPGDKKSMACSTYVPVRHNMGVLQNQPSSSTLTPYNTHLNPATQDHKQQHSQKGNTFSFYGSYQ